MKKRRGIRLLCTIVTLCCCMSCSVSVPNYLAAPVIDYPVIENLCTFGVQNMDGNAKVENGALTCHYDGFDVTYNIKENLMVSLVITNKTNKSLIIDKSKCYVLYDGYATELFKDVRSHRSTTFNNVQDAINNVQTNESGVSMTIPPYSKWELPLQETNVRQISKVPDFKEVAGVYSLNSYDNKETIEYVIPYSFDYSLAKWSTSRNRIYVNSVECSHKFLSRKYESECYNTLHLISNNQYVVLRENGVPDYSKANEIDRINQQKFKKHKRNVRWSQFLWGPFTLFTSWIYLGYGGCYNVEHAPYRYGDGSVEGSWRTYWFELENTDYSEHYH